MSLNLRSSSSCSLRAAVRLVSASVNMSSVFSFAIFAADSAFLLRADKPDALLDDPPSDFRLERVDLDVEDLRLSLSCLSSCSMVLILLSASECSVSQVSNFSTAVRFAVKSSSRASLSRSWVATNMSIFVSRNILSFWRLLGSEVSARRFSIRFNCFLHSLWADRLWSSSSSIWYSFPFAVCLRFLISLAPSKSPVSIIFCQT